MMACIEKFITSALFSRRGFSRRIDLHVSTKIKLVENTVRIQRRSPVQGHIGTSARSKLVKISWI